LRAAAPPLRIPALALGLAATLAAALGPAAGCARPEPGDGVVHAAVAANFAAPFADVGRAFEAATGQRVAVSAGSTGALYAQVVAGAPFEVFLAADEERPRLLVEAGLAVADSRFTYARGRLVLWSPGRPGIRPGDLGEPGYGRVALANPATAPYGAAAREALERLGLWRAVEPRAVYGSDVGKAFLFVATGNAAGGLVARSQLTAEQAREGWPVPQELHRLLDQQAVLLTAAAGDEGARALLAFLRGEAARALLVEHGYGVD
jgi:molybdate transport system substrate-binding protein